VGEILPRRALGAAGSHIVVLEGISIFVPEDEGKTEAILAGHGVQVVNLTDRGTAVLQEFENDQIELVIYSTPS